MSNYENIGENIPPGFDDNGEPIEVKTPKKRIDVGYFAAQEKKRLEWLEIQRNFPSTPREADELMRRLK